MGGSMRRGAKGCQTGLVVVIADILRDTGRAWRCGQCACRYATADVAL